MLAGENGTKILNFTRRLSDYEGLVIHLKLN